VSVAYWLLSVFYWRKVFGYWLLAIGYWLLAVGLAAICDSLLDLAKEDREYMEGQRRLWICGLTSKYKAHAGPAVRARARARARVGVWVWRRVLSAQF
jgi:hypothetical protein